MAIKHITGRSLHSSTFLLEVSNLVWYVARVQLASVTRMAQVELRSGRV
jgi:hypothetical protein